MNLHTFVVHVENKPGVLTRVSSLIRRRGFNIESLTVGHAETDGVSRAKDLVRMRMPIWYDAMQAPPATAARIARERGARPGAWLAAMREPVTSGVG